MTALTDPRSTDVTNIRAATAPFDISGDHALDVAHTRLGFLARHALIPDRGNTPSPIGIRRNLRFPIRTSPFKEHP
jgi:hypothetical protein